MKEPVDGIERAGTVLTKVKTEPELPEKMEVIYEDGTIKTVRLCGIRWMRNPMHMPETLL